MSSSTIEKQPLLRKKGLVWKSVIVFLALVIWTVSTLVLGGYLWSTITTFQLSDSLEEQYLQPLLPAGVNKNQIIASSDWSVTLATSYKEPREYFNDVAANLTDHWILIDSSPATRIYRRGFMGPGAPLIRATLVFDSATSAVTILLENDDSEGRS